MPFATVDDALSEIRDGRTLVVVDGPDRENEGDLTMAAEHVSPDAVNFMIRHGRGLVCMPTSGERLDHLRIGPMTTGTAIDDTPFTVSIDHHAVTTGISAHERAQTIRAVLEESSRPWDFRRPGHVFPLRARPGGVLERPGHTEAAVDLCTLAGMQPVAVICEVLRDDGHVARLPDLLTFAAHHGLRVVTVEQLIEYRGRIGALSDMPKPRGEPRGFAIRGVTRSSAP